MYWSYYHVFIAIVNDSIFHLNSHLDNILFGEYIAKYTVAISYVCICNFVRACVCVSQTLSLYI